MPPRGESDDRLVCAVLAAQVTELGDRISGGAGLETLWQASDMIARMIELSGAVVPESPVSDPEMTEEHERVIQEAARVRDMLEELALVQSQQMDFARQIAECVATALGRLATSEAADGARMPIEELTSLYVSEEQRRLHEAVAARHAARGATP